MPATIPTTIRFYADEKAALERLAGGAGLSVSDYVRRELGLRGEPADIDGLERRVTAVEGRLAQLEEMAGL